jgi:hypothetical protein
LCYHIFKLLINYIQNIAGKTLTVICRRQNVFKAKWDKQEVNFRNRCHVQNATNYLQSIKDNYSERQIKVVVAGIAEYVNSLDANEDVSSFF